MHMGADDARPTPARQNVGAVAAGSGGPPPTRTERQVSTWRAMRPSAWWSVVTTSSTMGSSSTGTV